MAVDELHERFGLRLRDLRRRKGWSQEELAARVQMSVGGISNLERGLSGPRLATIGKLAKALDILPFELFWLRDASALKKRNRMVLIEGIEHQLAALSDEDLPKVSSLIGGLIDFKVGDNNS